MSKLLAAIGTVLMLLVVGLKLANTDVLVLGTMTLHILSLLILSNIAFTVAVLLKK